MMHRAFLYRLFRHSKPAIILAVCFILFYAVSISKKMDMIFFPYNNMYAIDFSGNTTTHTYALKINGNPVKITGNLYWKKDMLETSLNGYCRYIKHGRKVFLHDYIPYKFKNEQLQHVLVEKLTPDEHLAYKWPYWFARTAGYPLKPGDDIEFMEYRFNLSDGKAVIFDSSSIYKTIIR